MSKSKTLKKEDPKLFADTNITMKSGRLTKDAEVVADGKFVKMRFAANKEYLNDNKEKKVITNYFNALVSKNLKDAFNSAQGLKKGDWVYIKGEDSTQSFDTPEGYKQTASTIFAYKVVLKKEKEESPSEPIQTQENANPIPSPRMG